MSTVMRIKHRWQDAVALVLGVWLLFAPFIIGYGSLNGLAAWNSYLVGAAVAIASAWALRVPEAWEESVIVLNLVLGFWLVTSPYVLDFSPSKEAAAWNELVVGLLIAADAIWALAVRPPGGAPVRDH